MADDNDNYPEVGEIERDVIAEDKGQIEADVEDGTEGEEEEEYEVAAIVGHRWEKTHYSFLVSWKGYGAEHNTWEPESNLVHASEMIDAYWDKQPKSVGNKRGRQSTGTPARAPQRRRVSQAAAAAPAKDDDVVYEDTHTDSSVKFMDIADWDGLIKQVDTVERGDNGKIVVYVTMKSGERLAQSTDLLNKRAPQSMIRFYEKHLKWNVE